MRASRADTFAAHRWTSRSRQWLGLVDQHHRDILADRINQLARAAREAVLLLGHLQFALALGTGENIEQLLADGHRKTSGVLASGRDACSGRAFDHDFV